MSVPPGQLKATINATQHAFLGLFQRYASRLYHIAHYLTLLSLGAREEAN